MLKIVVGVVGVVCRVSSSEEIGPPTSKSPLGERSTLRNPTPADLTCVVKKHERFCFVDIKNILVFRESTRLYLISQTPSFLRIFVMSYIANLIEVRSMTRPVSMFPKKKRHEEERFTAFMPGPGYISILQHVARLSVVHVLTLTAKLR